MFYKIIHGFSPEDYVEIEASELQKAYYCFLEKKDSLFSGGPIKGSQILEIKPDFHRIMGWNRGHKLGSEDFAELSGKGVDRRCQVFLAQTKDVVQDLIRTGRVERIGSVELPVEATQTGGMKHIGEINKK